jgi:thiamine biosynthesis lipoprotein
MLRRPAAPTWGERQYRFRHHPLLGTTVEIRVGAGATRRTAGRIDRVAVDEMLRLEQVFSTYRTDSELERWKRGEVPVPSEDLCSALALALDWQERSRGVFNTSSGTLTALWRLAEVRGVPPSQDEMAAAAAAVQHPQYCVEDGVPFIAGDPSGINLNAFVKGWIADRALTAASLSAPGEDIVVNAGGDLCHSGASAIEVGIENPLRPYDNEPPVARVRVANGGLATSGLARRGFRIAGRWYPHVIDPRTAAAVDTIASISVVASDAATADVLATIVGLLPPEEATDHCTAIGLACLVIDPNGRHWSNRAWADLEV